MSAVLVVPIYYEPMCSRHYIHHI